MVCGLACHLSCPTARVTHCERARHTPSIAQHHTTGVEPLPRDLPRSGSPTQFPNRASPHLLIMRPKRATRRLGLIRPVNRSVNFRHPGRQTGVPDPSPRRCSATAPPTSTGPTWTGWPELPRCSSTSWVGHAAVRSGRQIRASLVSCAGGLWGAWSVKRKASRCSAPTNG